MENRIDGIGMKETAEVRSTEEMLRTYSVEIMEDIMNDEKMEEKMRKYEALKEERESMIDLIKCLHSSIEKTGETWVAKYDKLEHNYKQAMKENEVMKEANVEMKVILKEEESRFKERLDTLLDENERLRTENIQVKNRLKVVPQSAIKNINIDKCTQYEKNPLDRSNVSCQTSYLLFPTMEDVNSELKRLSNELLKLQKNTKVSPDQSCDDVFTPPYHSSTSTTTISISSELIPVNSEITELIPINMDISSTDVNDLIEEGVTHPNLSSTFVVKSHVGDMTMHNGGEQIEKEPYVWEKHSSGLARSTMQNMGYKEGRGLGKTENGRTQAVGVSEMESTDKTIIFSSSITKGVNPNGFNKMYQKGTAKFERFHGRTAHDIKSYIPIHLQRDQYDTAIIAAGGNDLSNNSVNIDSIAEDIIEAGLRCREHMVDRIFICSVLPRRNTRYQLRRETLNLILKELCTMFGFIYIEMPT